MAKKTKQKKVKQKKDHTRLKRTVATLLLICILTGIICSGAFTVYLFKYINPKLDIGLADYKLDYTSVVYAMNNDTGEYEELEKLYKKENRIWVDIEDVPQHLLDAFVAIEDKRFFTHKGVDIKRTLGAILHFVTFSNKMYGGSTITQQLIKNITGDDDVKPQRKIEEILRAINLEKEYSKKQILEVYINTIYFGRSLNGVQTAANKYFGKDVSKLTLSECASLAGITNWPVKYDPYNNPENNKERRNNILYEMYDQGKISRKEYEDALNEELVFSDKSVSIEQKAQSWFVDQIIEDVINDLQKEKGYTKSYATQLLYSGGLKIYSTMDQDVQAAMDSVFTNESSFPKVGAKGTPQASMVIMDQSTGAVLGLVGGRGEKTGSRVLNRATQTYRQPGSTMKPLAVYAPAIEFNAINMATPVIDQPYKSKDWPKNYYDGYKGQMTVRKALEVSANTVPVHVLLNKLGLEKSFQFATKNLGLPLVEHDVRNGKTFSDKNASGLALGGVTDGVTVLDLTAAYASIANRGTYNKPYTYTKIVDNNGRVVLEKKVESTAAMSQETAYIMTKLLQDVVQNNNGASARISNQPSAGKTGTTSNDKDRWFVGFTPYYCGAVWFGFDTPKSIKIIGGNPATILWRQVMEKVHKGKKASSFPSSDNVVVQNYCIESGKLPGPNCKEVESGYFKVNNKLTQTCDIEKHEGVYDKTIAETEPTTEKPPQIIPKPDKPKPPKPDKPKPPKPEPSGEKPPFHGDDSDDDDKNTTDE